jgi:hypothetical protein
VRLTRYFGGLEATAESGANPGAVVDEFRELLGRAVRDRLRTPHVAITMSGGLDSPLVAMTAKRELARRFPDPELRAYCCVYDHLIPDDERRFAALAARSLSIPIEFQSLDGGSLFDWVGRLSPPEPIADFAVGPFLDQLSRVSRRCAVVLTGYDGDTLLRAAVRLHWRERLARGELAALARDLAWYVRTQRALPPIGVRTALAKRRLAHTPRRRPSWLREAFWTGAALEQRWAHGAAPLPVTRPRDPAVLGFTGPAWGSFFDAYAPERLGVPLELRHPLIDLRLIRFALRLPVVPWCVEKELLRRCLDGLPAEIRRRPKTPLSRDPGVELVRRDGLAAVPAPAPSDELSPFLDVRAARDALRTGPHPSDETWLALRAVALGIWLGQRGRPPATPPAAASA